MTHPTRAEIFEKDSWVGGPTHIFQKQHIPGYQGHVPSLVSEGLYSKSFAKLTSNCLENRVDKGFIINEDQRFHPTTKQEFTKPDLRKNALSQTAEQVLEDFNARNKTMNEALQKIKNQLDISFFVKKPFFIFFRGPKTINEVPPIDRVPVLGYMGFKPVFRYPLKQVKRQANDEIKDNTKFENLSQGFQLQLLQDEKLREKVFFLV